MVKKLRGLALFMRLVYLDAIRAVLSILVLLYHWGLTKLLARLLPGLEGGEWGLLVDYFLMLSGFVLCLSLSRRSINFFRFIAVRAFRLLPVAAIALTLCLVINSFSSPPSSASWREISANLFLVQSFVSVKSLPESMWSASFEMWLPGLFCFLGFLQLFGTRTLALAFIAFLLFECQVLSSPLLFDTAGLVAFARAVGGLGLGFILGKLFLRLRGLLLPSASSWYFWCGSLCFVSAIGGILLAPDFHVAGLAFPFFSALSIFLLSAAEWNHGCSFPLAAQGVIEYFATRSYSIYLLHMPLVDLSARFFGATLSGNATLKMVLIGATLIFSDVVYRFVEVPGYRLRKYFKGLC